MELTKICTKCREEKQVSEFYARKKCKHGVMGYCKDCHNLVHQNTPGCAYHELRCN